LAEDLGSGDISSALIPAEQQGRALIYAKAPGVVCGLPLVQGVYRQLDPSLRITLRAEDGERVEPGKVVAEIQGSLRRILQGERTALNFLQHLSGIATATREAVDRVQGLNVDIVDTRKTLPGLRLLQKYAVRVGGGKNHRFGLYDGLMIKDNHIKAAGSITRAVELARWHAGHMVKIEVECETLDQVEEALRCRVDVIMLDNMTLEDMRRAVKLINGRAIVEASGGITLDTLREVAETGVDVISIGRLTHSVNALDFSLDVGSMKEISLM